MANPREEFEGRYGPLWTGASSLSIGGVVHQLQDVLSRAGFGFEGIRLIDAPRTEAGRWAIRYFDGEDRQVVCLEFDVELNVVEEHRVHIAEWLGDGYFETEWQA